MSFTWSACGEDGSGVGIKSGKRTKTSHNNDSITVASEQSMVSNWDIDGGLAADFDGSLSGLGVELGSTTYNMSEALLALPVFKQENLDNVFQYILGAATSPAVKINEETLTYLNQGQSYEIKLKKLGDLSDCEGQYLRSTVRVCFHERRLQFMEKEQLDFWTSNRPGERILDIDIPLSYGLVDVIIEPNKLNAVDIVWDPTKETGVYVKVNCISTEFTAKKHGGEKGVPFRLQIESNATEDENSKLIHCASCQIKVFKPKGADRKHKTDREKMEKRQGAEKDKYQPSYECTVLTEIPLDQVTQNNSRNGHNVTSFGSLAQAFKEQSISPITRKPQATPVSSSGDAWRWNPSPGQNLSESPAPGQSNISPLTSSTVVKRILEEPVPPQGIEESPSVTVPNSVSIDATAKEVTAWLQYNRFSHYVNVFQNFSGSDLLRLTRDDLIQICGLADGIRLNNALQSRNVRPRMTLYICQEPSTVYHAIYLEQLTQQELIKKVSELYNVSMKDSQIVEAFVQGPSAIHILLSDEVVRNFQEQSRFWMEILKDRDNPSMIRLLLKAIE